MPKAKSPRIYVRRLSGKKLKAELDLLESIYGPIGRMMGSALAVQPMTPDELIGCLMSKPYNLTPTEQNLARITEILNEGGWGVEFRRERGCFSVRTLIIL